MKDFHPLDLQYLDFGNSSERRNEQPKTYVRSDSIAPDDLPDLLYTEYLTPQQQLQRTKEKALRTAISAAVGFAGYGLNRLGAQMEKDAKLPKVVTVGMRFVGKAAEVGSKVATTFLIADTAYAGSKYVQSDLEKFKQTMEAANEAEDQMRLNIAFHQGEKK